jgi:hypothetical protein
MESDKKFIELDRPENKDNIKTLYFKIINGESLKPIDEEIDEENKEKEVLTVKVIENSLNNVVYIKFINQKIPQENICKKVIESFTYQDQKENRRVSLLEVAGQQSLQDYIIATSLKNDL